MEAFAHYCQHLVDVAGYPGLYIVMVLGNIGMPVGTELVVPIAGALSATGHLSSVWIVAVIATLGELSGGTVLYVVGRYGGHPFVERYGKYLHLRPYVLERVHRFYERYGAVTVLLCRFIPFVRGVAALPAGLSEMPFLPFLLYTIVGSSIYCFGLALLGHAFGQHIGAIVPLVRRFSLIVVVLAVAAIVIFTIRTRGARAAV